MHLCYYFIFTVALMSNADAVLALISTSSPYKELVNTYGTLCDAVKAGDYKRVQSLLNYFYDSNVQDSLGYTPLHWAVANDDECITRLLVERGATPLPSIVGITPLHIAAFKGNIVLIDVLLKQGDHINYKDTKGFTALYHAAFKEDLAVIAFLLDKGACTADIPLDSLPNKTVKNMIQFYPELLVASYSNVMACNQLLSKGAQLTPLMLSNLDKLSQLFSAVDKKNVTLIKLFIDWGSSINAKDITGDTLLHKAMKTQDATFVKQLLELNANPASVDAQGRTPIYLASTAELVRIFIYKDGIKL